MTDNFMMIQDGLSGHFATYIIGDKSIYDFVDEHIDQCPDGIVIQVVLFNALVGNILVKKDNKGRYLFCGNDGDVVRRTEKLSEYFPKWAVEMGAMVE